MAQYPKITLTNSGLNMIAESQGGTELIFTKMIMGDGELASGEDIKVLTGVKNAMLTVPLQGFLNQGEGQVRLRFAISNETLNTGFFAREIGVYAKLGESGAEQLYAYTNAGNKSDYMPDKSVPLDSQILDLYIIVGNASGVSAVLDGNAAYATKLDLTEHNTSETSHEDIRKKIGTDITNHNANKDAHQNGIKGNAATATKLQTARKINGVSFDGTTDITITDDTKSPATHTHNYAGSSSAGGVANSAKDSDTVDGKHATDFAPAGYGLGGEVCLLNSGSANDLINTGFFNATPSVTDLPKTGCYYYITVMRHKSVNTSADTTKVTKQIAYSLQPAKDGTNIYERTQYEGVWTSWKQIATTEFIKNELDKFETFTIIYPNGGSKANPANVAVNSRYVMNNPFPGYHVDCEVEIFVNAKWGNSGLANGMKDGSWISYGVAAKQFNDDAIVVQTASAGVTGGTSNIMMDQFGINVQNILTSAPCRIKVWKVGKIS